MKQHATDEIKTINVSVHTAAGTTAVTSSVVDMQGYDAARVIGLTGDATSGTVLTLALKSNSANSTSSPTPVTESSCTVTSLTSTDCDNKLLITDVIKPTGRYVFGVFTPATQNCEINGMIIELYRAKSVAVTQDATVVASAKAVAGGVV